MYAVKLLPLTLYFVINQTDSTLYIKGGPTSPTTGVSIGSGNGAVVAWSGSDFVSIGGVTGIVAVQNGGTGQIYPFRTSIVVYNNLLVHQRLGGYTQEGAVGP